MKKFDRMEAFLRKLPGSGNPAATVDPCYSGFFTCFNSGEYYEAHDVLEHLWLQTRDANSDFYKGLIQFAGAFVHLRKQFLRPDHPTDGRRLAPAVRLFNLAAANLRPYAPRHQFLDVAHLLKLCANFSQRIEDSGFKTNPWSPDCRPVLHLES